MANLILRSTVNSGDTTKGSPLTNAEVDANFINLDNEIATLKTDLAAPAGSSLFGYSAGSNSVARTAESKFRETVSVLDFGADPTGVTDSTAAFNLATMSWILYGGDNDFTLRRDIYVPPGNYKISGTVYVRRGQRIYGAGEGASRIISDSTNSNRKTFVLGRGFISNIVTDDAGSLPAIIEKLHIGGGDQQASLVDSGASGTQIRDLFISSAEGGVKVWGSDTTVTRCYFDQVNVAITAFGQNQVISDCQFKQNNYGILVLSSSFDNQIKNCRFEHSAYNDIVFGDAATNIKNVSISNCQFTKDGLDLVSDSGIKIQSIAAEINIRGCDFRNQRGYSINSSSGSGNIVRVNDCTFNGLKTVTSYTQSTTSAGIETFNSEYEITNCRFENLSGSSINVSHSAVYTVTVRDCLFKTGHFLATSTVAGTSYTILSIGTTNFTLIGAATNTVGLTFVANGAGAGTGTVTKLTSYIALTGSTGIIEMYNNRGDDILPLFNTQNTVYVRARGNIRWLGMSKVSGSRRYWLIPTQRATIVQVNILAATVTDQIFRQAITFLAARKIGGTGTTYMDYATEVPIYETPMDGTGIVIETAVELDSVGAGATLSYVNIGRNLLVSIPVLYGANSIEVDYVTSN